MILTEVFLIILYIFYKSDNLCEKFATGPNMQPGLPKIFNFWVSSKLLNHFLIMGVWNWISVGSVWMCEENREKRKQRENT